MSDKKSQQVVQHVYTKSQNLKNSTWRCHYCGKHGHIRPYCYRLHGYPQSQSQSRINTQSFKARKEWKPRGNNGEVLMTSVRSKKNCFMWVPKNVALLQSHSSTDDVTKKRMKHVAKKKKSTKNVSSHVTPNAPIIAPAIPVDSVSVNPGVIVTVVATEMLEKPLEKVVQETEVQVENVVEETDVADDVPTLGPLLKEKNVARSFL